MYIALNLEKLIMQFPKRRSLHSLVLATLLVLSTTALSMQGPTVIKRVRFPHGRTTTVLKGVIVNDAMNQYFLAAKAGQTMSVHVTSPRGRAQFDVYPRNDRQAMADSAEDVKDWEGKLPQSGDYVISVYSTGGNTRYTLEVTIR
jgi:hypothetical protein